MNKLERNNRDVLLYVDEPALSGVAELTREYVEQIKKTGVVGFVCVVPFEDGDYRVEVRPNPTTKGAA